MSAPRPAPAAVPAHDPHEPAPVAERARGHADLAKAPSTGRAERAEWRDFAARCEGHGLAALTAARETSSPPHANAVARRPLPTARWSTPPGCS